MKSYTEYDCYQLDQLLQKREELSQALDSEIKSTLDIDHSSNAIAYIDQLIIKKQTIRENIDCIPESENKTIKQDSVFSAKSVIFHGKSREYFSIWITNTLLTLLTLGVYSAWATVRSKRYFYANTEIDGHRFQYHGKAVPILIGRIIAVAAVALLIFLGQLAPYANLLYLGFFIVIGPILICRSASFNRRMVSYRQVRFSFKGRYFKAMLLFCIYPVLTFFTAYLALPFVLRAQDKFLFEHTSFGDSQFSSDLKIGDYYNTCAMALFLLFFCGISLQSIAKFIPFESVFSNFDRQSLNSVIVLLSLYFVGAIYNKMIRNHIFAHIQLTKKPVSQPSLKQLSNATENETDKTQLTQIAAFKSEIEFFPLFLLYASNFFAFCLTAGFALPWIRIRNARFFTQTATVFLSENIGQIIAENHESNSAVGDEISGVLNIETGFA